MEQEKFDDCMLRICRGDKNALREIYEAYATYVYSTVFRIVNNRTDAEDISSEFFLKLWTNSDKYVPGNGHKAFLATMARNMAIDYLRKHNREVLIGDFSSEEREEESDQIPAEVLAAESTVESVVEKEVLEEVSMKEAFERLKPREQEVIHYKIMGDMTFKEIAEVMQIPMGTVTWLYRQAIEKLRRCGYE